MSIDRVESCSLSNLSLALSLDDSRGNYNLPQLKREKEIFHYSSRKSIRDKNREVFRQRMESHSKMLLRVTNSRLCFLEIWMIIKMILNRK